MRRAAVRCMHASGAPSSITATPLLYLLLSQQAVATPATVTCNATTAPSVGLSVSVSQIYSPGTEGILPFGQLNAVFCEVAIRYASTISIGDWYVGLCRQKSTRASVCVGGV